MDIYGVMAGEVVICELLCFLRKIFDKTTVSQLKPTLVSFYNDDETIYAKDVLHKAVLNVAKDVGTDVDIPRLPKRQGDNKSKLETKAMTTSSHCNTGRMCVTLPIITREKHFPIYTRCSENHNNTCAENRKIRGLKFDTLYWRHLAAYRKI